MDKALILNKIQEALMFNVDAEFANYLGITRQRLAGWKTRGTFNTQILYTKCESISKHFILTGEEPVTVEDENERLHFVDYRELTEEEDKVWRANHELWAEFIDECFRRKQLNEDFHKDFYDIFKSEDELKAEEAKMPELENYKDKLIAVHEERIKELKEYIELLKDKVKA